MYCPDAIALGGGVMKSGDRFMPVAREVIRRNCAMVPFEKTAIVDAELGSDTGLIGAARVWCHRFDAGVGR
jgi:glucokinase